MTAGVYFYIADAPYIPGRGYLVKIGRSKNPYARARELQTACPYKIGQLWIFDACGNDSVGLEHEFHETFKLYRVRNEWFHILPWDLSVSADKWGEAWNVSGFEVAIENRRIVRPQGIQQDWYFDEFHAGDMASKLEDFRGFPLAYINGGEQGWFFPSEYPQEQAA